MGLFRCSRHWLICSSHVLLTASLFRCFLTFLQKTSKKIQVQSTSRFLIKPTSQLWRTTQRGSLTLNLFVTTFQPLQWSRKFCYLQGVITQTTWLMLRKQKMSWMYLQNHSLLEKPILKRFIKTLSFCLSFSRSQLYLRWNKNINANI